MWVCTDPRRPILGHLYSAQLSLLKSEDWHVDRKALAIYFYTGYTRRNYFNFHWSGYKIQSSEKVSVRHTSGSLFFSSNVTK